ncbi:hypothetical protein CkaCkLH20_03231 [Colletotrichum karsti]|uniref:CorA-like transporter domain-containing protein n=1 Tax=Colletotrichum karsti TaxID=1095194 RepID=A0A9P6LMN0_9PEZI|nr:uncharacterized protein CkaCkLH20_03231 [Colletotrichum karsti]KAF9878998.1 hypothetical protein CkaCkLH20_03231 [Colletotrichum karsti]
MHNEELFRGKLAVAETYPASLLHEDERRIAIRARREHYEANKDKIFDTQFLGVEAPLIIIDFKDGDASPVQEGSKGTTLHTIRNIAGLRRKLSLPTRPDAGKGSRALVRDPALRIVLLERLAPTSLLLPFGEEVLLELLTYHQIPSYFLSFLASGGESWGFASSTHFSGFRGATNLLSQDDRSIASLGRSGKHVQLCLTLLSTRQYPLYMLPKGADPDRTSRWETHSAALYLHFDIVEGTAVWLIASPKSYHPVKGGGKRNLLWDTLKENAAGMLEEVPDLDVPGRFRVSLDSLVAVAEWSIGEDSLHLQDLETRLYDLTKDYLHPFDEDDDEPPETIPEQGLRDMAHLMEQRHKSAMAIDNNLRVLRRLQKFIVEQVSGSLETLDLRHAERMRIHIKDFGVSLSSVIEEMADLAERAQALDQLAEHREEYIQRMQTHHANQQMRSIAELTADDSSAMKQLSFIALILLPVTVVSTVLSTDIVKFQDLSNENEDSGAGTAGGGPPEAPVPVYSFSVAAFGTWAVASVVMTVVTLAIVKPVGGRRSRGGGGKSPNSHGSFRFSRLQKEFSKPRKLRGAIHSADEEERMASEPSPAARSIHTAPMVTKTASHPTETPEVGVGVPVQAGASQKVTWVERWLKAVWVSLWRRGRTMEQASAAVSGLPR